MTTEPGPTKIGDSAFFLVDVRSYSAPVTRFDPILANQSVVFEPEPIQELEPAAEEEQQPDETEP